MCCIPIPSQMPLLLRLHHFVSSPVMAVCTDAAVRLQRGSSNRSLSHQVQTGPDQGFIHFHSAPLSTPAALHTHHKHRPCKGTIYVLKSVRKDSSKTSLREQDKAIKRGVQSYII